MLRGKPSTRRNITRATDCSLSNSSAGCSVCSAKCLQCSLQYALQSARLRKVPVILRQFFVTCHLIQNLLEPSRISRTFPYTAQNLPWSGVNCFQNLLPYPACEPYPAHEPEPASKFHSFSRNTFLLPQILCIYFSKLYFAVHNYSPTAECKVGSQPICRISGTFFCLSMQFSNGQISIPIP